MIEHHFPFDRGNLRLILIEGYDAAEAQKFWAFHLVDADCLSSGNWFCIHACDLHGEEFRHYRDDARARLRFVVRLLDDHRPSYGFAGY